MAAQVTVDQQSTGSKTRARWTVARRVTAVAAIAAGVALAAALLSPPGGARAACSEKGAVVVVPGTNDPTGEGSMKGIIETAKQDGKDVIVVGYPTTLWPMGSVGFDKDVQLGKAATSKAISDYQSACGLDSTKGDTGKVQVVGYSQGARVAGDVLADIGQGKQGAPSAQGVSGLLYADPRQEGPESGRGIERNFLGVLPGLTMSGSRGGFGVLAGNVVSVCSQGDPICDLPDPLHDPLGAIDGLVGYFVKHGDYPLLGAWGFDKAQNKWYWENPTSWTDPDNCVTAKNGGGTVCTKPQGSSIGRLISQFGDQLGIHDIPDFFGETNKVLNIDGIAPHANLNDLQPMVDLVFKALPKLPYLTDHAGGYLPDALAFGNLANGVVQVVSGGNGSMLRGAATAIGLSVVSILLIPVNDAVYRGNQLGEGLGIGKIFGEGTLKWGLIPDQSKDWSLPPHWADGVGPTGTSANPLVAGQAGPSAGISTQSKAAFISSVKAAEGTSLWRTAQRGSSEESSHGGAEAWTGAQASRQAGQKDVGQKDAGPHHQQQTQAQQQPQQQTQTQQQQPQQQTQTQQQQPQQQTQTQQQQPQQQSWQQPQQQQPQQQSWQQPQQQQPQQQSWQQPQQQQPQQQSWQHGPAPQQNGGGSHSEGSQQGGGQQGGGQQGGGPANSGGASGSGAQSSTFGAGGTGQ